MPLEELLQHLSKYPELFSLIFFEGISTGSTPYRKIEEKEPGYFQALSNTFIAFLYQLKYQMLSKEITQDYIQTLHAECTSGVKNLNARGNGKEFLVGTYFELNFREIRDGELRQACREELLTDPDRNQLYTVFTRYQKPDRSIVRTNYKKTIPWDVPLFLENGTAETEADELRLNEQRVQRILDDYNQEIAHIHLVDESYHQIAVIVKLVQRLERLHPFGDANCRTFCMMLLNIELIKHGMLPTLQDDPNYFDILTRKELVKRVKIGQERFKYYCDHPDTIMEYQPLNKLFVTMLDRDSWMDDPLHKRHQQQIRKKLEDEKIREEKIHLFLKENQLTVPTIWNFAVFLKQPLETIKSLFNLLNPIEKFAIINRKAPNGQTLISQSSFTNPSIFKFLLGFSAEIDIENVAVLKKLEPLVDLLSENALDIPVHFAGIKGYLFTGNYSAEVIDSFASALRVLSLKKILNKDNLVFLIEHSNIFLRNPSSIAESLVILHKTHILNDENRRLYAEKLYEFGSEINTWLKQLKSSRYLNQESFAVFIKSKEAPKRHNHNINRKALRLLAVYAQHHILDQLIVNSILINPSLTFVLRELDKFLIPYSRTEFSVYLAKINPQMLSKMIPIIQNSQSTIQALNEVGVPLDVVFFDFLIQSLLKNNSFEEEIHAGVKQLKEAGFLTYENLTVLMKDPVNIKLNVGRLVGNPEQPTL